MEDHSPIAKALQKLEDLTGEDLKAAWAQLRAAGEMADVLGYIILQEPVGAKPTPAVSVLSQYDKAVQA